MFMMQCVNLIKYILLIKDTSDAKCVRGVVCEYRAFFWRLPHEDVENLFDVVCVYLPNFMQNSLINAEMEHRPQPDLLKANASTDTTLTVFHSDSFCKITTGQCPITAPLKAKHTFNRLYSHLTYPS